MKILCYENLKLYGAIASKSLHNDYFKRCSVLLYLDGYLDKIEIIRYLFFSLSDFLELLLVLLVLLY